MKIFRRILCVMGFLLPAIYSNAQLDTLINEGDTVIYTTNKQTYTQVFDSFAIGLNKSLVPFGVLYDRVFPFAELVDTTKHDTVSLPLFIQAYSEWQRSDYNYLHRDTVFDHTDVYNFVKGEYYRDTIPIFTLNANFASIDTNAYADGRIDTAVGGFLSDGSNTASPYLQHHILWGVVGTPKKLDSGRQYHFQFQNYYEFGNNSHAVSSVVITDPVENETWTFNSSNRDIPLTFEHPGRHLLNIEITLSNSETAEFHQWLEIAAKATYGGCTTDVITIPAGIAVQGDYGESQAYNGEGEYQVFYGTNNNCLLKKPIIVLDGFDAGNTRPIQTIYEEYLTYKSNSINVSLAQELRDLGYDVVVLNFTRFFVRTYTKTIPPFGTILFYEYKDGGADFIQRNAMVLISLIDEMNSRLDDNNSNEKLVIVGPSMGGQISRYALRHMQINSWGHNTRLWLSFDSPHHGANIPWGFQDMMRVLAERLENSAAREKYDNLLRSPAARQMLIHQTYPGGFENHPSQAAAAFRNEEATRLNWRNTLANIGYPSGMRRIALVNGRRTGGDFQTKGDEMFRVLAYVMFSIKALDMTPYFMHSVKSKIISLAWKNNKLQDFKYSISTHSGLPYKAIDGAPGGLYPVQQEFLREIPSFGLLTTFWGNNTENSCFIPTVSALALYNPNFEWTSSLNLEDILCNNKTPFSNIYVPTSNENHVSLTAASAAWVKQEIQKGQPSNSSLPWIWDCIWELTGQHSIQTLTVKNYGWGSNNPTEADGDVEWTTSSNIDIVDSDISGISIEAQSVAENSFIEAKILNPYGADKIIRKDLEVTSNKNSNQENDNRGTKRVVVSRDGTRIYPNPSQDVWNISVGKKNAVSISAELYNAMGVKVSEVTSDGREIQLRNEHLPAGVYHLKLTVDRETKTYKLLK